MMSSDPNLNLAEQIDVLCDEFETAWKASLGPRLEDYWNRLPAEAREQGLASLLRVELELRVRSGMVIEESTYYARFPTYRSVVAAAFAEARGQGSVGTSDLEEPVATIAHEPQTHESQTIPAPPVSSSSFLGRFEVLGLIGEGAFGQVLRARDPHLDREVAIKLPRDGTLTGPDSVERFMREARAAATMHHPNICPVYEVGTADGRPYIVMSLVPGKSLAEHLEQAKRPMDVRQAVTIVRKLAQALELAHSKGIIHRDLKPANILVDRERRDIVVMDFGLARYEKRDSAQLTQTGMVMGTPAYMPPEQARGDHKAVGPASDVYSLGVILYELLTGRRPFEGSIAEVLGKILHVSPVPPSAKRREIDARLDAICMKAMAKSTADRFRSMRELHSALTAYLKEQPSSGTLQSVSSVQADKQPLTELFPPLADDREGKAAAATEARTRRRTRRQKTPLPMHGWWVAASAVGLMVLAGIAFFALRDDGAGVDPREQIATEPPQAEWVSLFNGQDLTGWKTHSTQPGNWRVENGILIGKSEPVSHLFTERGDFGDFHLRAEVRVHPAGNGGIFFRCPFAVERGGRYPFGYEAQVVADATAQSTSNGAGTLIVHTPENPTLVTPTTADPSSVRAGQWFTYEVIAREKHFTLKVDGQTTAEYEDTGLGILKGHIALQVMGQNSVMELRKLEVAEFSEPARPDFVALFNGKDLRGWTPFRSTGPNADQQVPTTTGWEVRDGALTCTTADPGWLRFDRKLRDFELELEFRIPSGANSGLLVRSEGTGAIPSSSVEVQITDDQLATRREHRSGAIFAVAGPVESALKPTGEWNALHVTCAGDRVRVRLNGQETADLDLEGYPALRGRPNPGYIGLYNWQGMAKGTAFRHIRARDLSAQSANASPSTSRLEPITELNTPHSDSFAWVSPDGLRIYFTRQAEPNEKPQTYRATRTSTDAPFRPAEYLSSMRHAVMSGDELYMIGIDGDRSEVKLHHARRSSVNSDFAPTSVIDELADQANPKSPWLGSNGLNLVFQRKDSVGGYPGKVASDDATSQTEFVLCRRPSIDSKWSEPRRLPLLDDPLYSDALTWPSLSDDGLTLFFCNGGGRFPEVMYATRSHRQSAFGSPRKVAIDGKPLLGRAPRYVEATRELFVTRYSDASGQSENWDLWVVKDFVPDRRASFQGTCIRPWPIIAHGTLFASGTP